MDSSNKNIHGIFDQQIVRGYFGLGDHETVVHISCDSNFLLHIWARNVESSPGGVTVITPASQFQGNGATGHPYDALVLDVPPQTGMDLGCIGGRLNETINISSAFGARVTVFLTLVTEQNATVHMVGDPINL
jgi:hypothetical protein